MKIALIGTGVYGMSMALMLNKNEKNIIMWSESQERYKKYLEDGCIKDIIPGISAPKNIKLTCSYEEATKDADVVFIISTAAFVSSICNEINQYINKDTVICIASKGIENHSCRFLSDIAYQTLKTKNIAVISGPSFAIDMVNNNPIGLSIASKEEKAINTIKKVLESDTIKLRETDDLIGIQICGSIKNVIAVASGILNGLNYPESTQCFLITEALNDIKNLIAALGGNAKTINSFAGVGDLILTCTSTKSRNYSFGKFVGQGATKEEKEVYLQEHTVEGYYTLKSIYKLVQTQNIEMPIIDLIYKIIINNENPQELITFLINKK